MPDEAIVAGLAPGEALFCPVETGYAKAVEGRMVAGTATGHFLLHGDGNRHLAEVGIDRCNRRFEHGLHRGDATQAALITGAPIIHKAGRNPVQLAGVPEPFGVASGTMETLFLSAPKTDANGAPGLNPTGRKDPRGFNHHRRTGAIVLTTLGTGAVPGIQVGREDHHLVGEFGAGNVGDHIEHREWAFGEKVHQVGFEFH